jgi:hypothetical protein
VTITLKNTATIILERGDVAYVKAVLFLSVDKDANGAEVYNALL